MKKNKKKSKEFVELHWTCPHCNTKNSIETCENILFDDTKEEFMQCYNCKKWF